MKTYDLIIENAKVLTMDACGMEEAQLAEMVREELQRSGIG